MKNSYYYLAALASFIIWGFVSLCLKPLQLYPALDILFFRIFFSAGIICIVTFLFRPKNFKEQRIVFKNLGPKEKQRTIFLTLLGGLLLAANWFFFIYVMNTISIKTAAFAYLICPILTTVLAGILLDEKLSKIQWIAVMMSALSCIILGMHSAVELSYSMIVALSYALYLISQRGNKHLDKFVILTFQLLSAALILLPFAPIFGSTPPVEISFYLLVTLLATLFTIVPLYLNLIALKVVNSSTMGILLYINPLLSFVVAFLYFDEQISLGQLLAYAFILLSIIVFNTKVIRSLFNKTGPI